MNLEEKIDTIIKSNLKGDELISMLNEHGFKNMSELNKETKYKHHFTFGFEPKLDEKDYYSNLYIRFNDDFSFNEAWGVNISNIRADINLIKTKEQTMVKKRKRIRKPRPTKVCSANNGEITYSKK